MIRAAAVEDAPAIGALKVRAWRAAYAGFMSRGFLDGLDPDREAGDWAEYLAAIPDTDRLWVAEEAGSVLGYCRTGPADGDPNLGPRAAEIYGLYVAPDRIGSGLGRELFGHAVADLEERGHRPLCVYAYVPNDRALRFYERAGFAADGVTRLDDDISVTELRLVKPRS
ncbi:GNAT family N-acetyltransferase [Actinoallomurus acanthiterrae]